MEESSSSEGGGANLSNQREGGRATSLSNLTEAMSGTNEATSPEGVTRPLRHGGGTSRFPEAPTPEKGDDGGCEKPQGALLIDIRGAARRVSPAAILSGPRWGVQPSLRVLRGVQVDLLDLSHEAGPQSRVGMMAPLGVASPALPGGFPALKASGDALEGERHQPLPPDEPERSPGDQVVEDVVRRSPHSNRGLPEAGERSTVERRLHNGPESRLRKPAEMDLEAGAVKPAQRDDPVAHPPGGEIETGPQSRVGMTAPLGVASPALPGGFPALKASGERAQAAQEGVDCSHTHTLGGVQAPPNATPSFGVGCWDCAEEAHETGTRGSTRGDAPPPRRRCECLSFDPVAGAYGQCIHVAVEEEYPFFCNQCSAGECGCLCGGCGRHDYSSETAATELTRAKAEAATALQRYWRWARRRLTLIETNWTGPWARLHGKIEGHVRYLQWLFRKAREVSPSCWRERRLRAPIRVVLTWGRSHPTLRCQGGMALAGAAEFAEQRALSDEMLDWYAVYVSLLRRLESGVTPFSIQNFSGGGGSSEGCRRAGGACHGIDLYDQEDYRRRFGDESFSQRDGMSWSTIKALRDKHRASFIIGGPPCKFYSRARVKGEAKQPPLIDGFRDMCVALFGHGRLWAIENVMGAARHMAKSAKVVDGAYFGLQVARARLYETNFDLHIDACVRGPADKLAARCCLGRRRRFRRFDEFGRPVVKACCAGNIFAVQGTSPWRCTADECAAAMGVDVGHMSFERLAQSVPPAYGQLVFAQMCMRQAQAKFGAPAITFDEMRASPARSKRQLAFWLRGAGAPEAETGQLFAPAPSVAAEPPRSSRAEKHPGGGCAREAEFRELYYSHAGGYDQQWVVAEVEGRLERVANGVTLREEPKSAGWLGKNTYVEVGPEALLRAAEAAAKAAALGGPGTRATFVAPLRLRRALESLGFEYLPCAVGGKGPDALAYQELVAMHVGRRAGVRAEHHLDHDRVRPAMDWRDRGDYETDALAKARLSWEYYPHDAERYRDKGLPPWVEKMMVEGAVVEVDSRVFPEDVDQYQWPDGVALVEAIMETERHLAIGALEYVPDAEVADVLAGSVVHPILLVSQGKGKFRACHDYSRGTNRTARSTPFSLPSVWDAREAVKPGSFFCKYDLRDGFFAVPVHPASRNRLVVRHPATGRLLRCARLPFGYLDSPRLFCGLTEAIADEVRRRTVGMGVYVFVFVDDFLIVGDDEAAARKGGEVLEQVLFEFGIPWAPHKQRGPSICIEFLGLLLSNVPGHRCVALTEKRQAKLREQIDEWLGRRDVARHAGSGVEGLTVDIKELASFLGHLVFCSQVVPQGRTYMQAMLSQFAGLEVDWRRGEVRPSRSLSKWRRGIVVLPGFWRDLEWWSARFERRNCTSMEMPAKGEVAICGTDASDWGTGQLMWDSGQRAEVVLRFTLAERARSINWRELLGILRVLEQYGEELQGRALLIEGDNTSSLSAAVNGTSKAEDSQELVRRLVERTELHDLTVRFTHTPGVKLDRPDQTSRGDPIEEPRARVKQEVYRSLDARFGPFTEWVGAERRFAPGGANTRGRTARLWMHPAHATVGSALRRLGERMGDADGSDARGVVIVPHDETAKWWPLVRHFDIVGRWPAGSSHLEASRLGTWGAIRASRASLILAFPRNAGGQIRPVRLPAGATESGYEEVTESMGVYALPLERGAILYAPGPAATSSSAEERGSLYYVEQRFKPASEGETLFDADDETDPTVQVAELLLLGTARTAERYVLDHKASFSGRRHEPWSVSSRLLWDVSHLVTFRSVGRWDGVHRAGAKYDILAFSWREASRQIRARSEGVADEGPFPRADDSEATGALEDARASAAQAAAARTRPVVQPRNPEGEPAAATAPLDAPSVLRCKYSEMLCEGCSGSIGWGKVMWPGGRGMVHPDEKCREMAELKLKLDGHGATGNDSIKRQVQVTHRLSEARVGMALQCLEGCCASAVVNEVKTMCIRGCGRGVHIRACCGLSEGIAQLGNVTCAHCRAADLIEASCTPNAKVVRRMVESMLVELSTGQANTHKGYSDLAMLERRWQEEIAGGPLAAREVKLPHTSAEGTYHFVLWLATDGRRARSMGTTLRQLSSFCTKLELPNYAKSKRIKTLLHDMQVKGGAVTSPDTQVTSLMIGEMYGMGGTIQEACQKVPKIAELVTARETCLNDLELVGGMRVAEVCGGGDGHGLLANLVCIQRVTSGPGSEHGTTIEARIEDSKTGYPRWTVFTSETRKTHIQTVQHMLDWWRLSGLETVESTVGAFEEERPDYWVARVSLLGMDQGRFDKFVHDVEWASGTCSAIMETRRATLKYAALRWKGRTLGEEMRYVNVAGGSRKGRPLAEAVAWLSHHGLGAYTDVTMGPLFRATLGHALTHMPYSPSSTHVHLVPAMRAAFRRVQESGVPDPEYDATTDPEPKFANHSNRRHADRVAMRGQAESGITDEDINFFFGWELKKMAERMALHYRGLDRVLRLRLSRVTEGM